MPFLLFPLPRARLSDNAVSTPMLTLSPFLFLLPVARREAYLKHPHHRIRLPLARGRRLQVSSPPLLPPPPVSLRDKRKEAALTPLLLLLYVHVGDHAGPPPFRCRMGTAKGSLSRAGRWPTGPMGQSNGVGIQSRP
jgi:hypothetical protein